MVVLIALMRSSPSAMAAAPNVPDPLPWQQSATGMKKSQYGNVGGLEMIVNTNGWPRLSLRGGVGSVGYESVGGPVGVELGQIMVPGATSATLTNETVDWAKNEMTFNYGSGSLKVWATRTSPAVLVQTPSNALRIFTGNVSRYAFCINSGQENDICKTSGAAYPKYVAYPNSAGTQIRTLSTSATSLAGINKFWLLLWYGNSTHAIDTKKPISYTGPDYDNASLPISESYYADAPILLIFEKQPTSIKHATGGGVEVTFASASSYMLVLPILGRDHRRATETEGWATSFPSSLRQKADWWSNHLCSYPTTTRESYAYSATTDTASITATVTFLSVCAGGTQFAPIPPIVGIVKDILGITFSGTVVDAGLPTEYGPTLGIENASQYTWSVSQLRKYVDAKRSIGSNSVPSDLQQELDSQTQKIIAGGHFAPWIFMDDFPFNPGRGELYWANPADTLYHLIEIAQALPDGTLKTNLTNHIRAERNSYPPEDAFDLPLDPNSGAGTVRQNYTYYGRDLSSVLYDWSPSTGRKDEHLLDVPLYNFYSLARYYDFTKDSVPSSVLTKAQTVLDRDMREQDWATSYWFYGFQDRRMATVNATRHWEGMLGYVRLATALNDSTSINLGMALLAKATVLRVGMTRYPRYLYANNLVELPSRPDWQPYYTRWRWRGHIFNYNWTGAYDDARQAYTWDQYEVYLYDHSGNERWGYDPNEFTHLTSSSLIGYRDMVPELGRLLTDYVKTDAEIYADKVAANIPHWYAAFAEATLGMEHNLNHPVDSFQIFMAKAWIKGESADALAKYTDIPWLEAGDLFYVQKLAEAVKAYRGNSWSDTLLLGGAPMNRAIRLDWVYTSALPPSATWQITYTGPTGSQPSPVTGIPISTRTYTLTGLTNYSLYSVTLAAMLSGTVVVTSNTVGVMPTDRFVYLPFVNK
jgi:hypothetical protein